MKNNKLTRKRALKLASKQQFVKQIDGTEVLVTRESRAKVRRWSFEADVELVFPKPTNEDGSPKLDDNGNELPAPLGISRTMKLDTVSYSEAKAARSDCKTHELYLRSMNKMFETAKIRVRAIPHETVSNTTIKQLSGYRDMSMVLDRALGIAIDLVKEVAGGKSTGGEVATLDTSKAKELVYKQALDAFKADNEKPNVVAEGEDVSKTKPTIELTDADSEQRKEFVPEIVNPESVIA